MKNEEVKTEVIEDTPEYCGGKVKPQDIKGKIGEWNCVGGEWVWSDFVGK